MTDLLEHPTSHTHDHEDDAFDRFAAAVQHRFDVMTCEAVPLFTTDVTDLYGLYLDNLRTSERQHHTCHCCRQFIERFGNLVVIGEDGSTHSVLWNAHTAPVLFKQSVEAMERAVRRANVDGVFLTNEKVWGTPVTGKWHHFSIKPAAGYLHKDRLMTPFQAMALKKQDFGTLSHGLADFSRGHVATALNLLESDALYRSEKVIGPARFLLGVHDAISAAPNRRKNIIWAAVALAPVGFATPRGSMIGTLLSDIADGLSYDDVSRRFRAKMHPLQYQRPQAPARAGNIEQAEKIVEKLGIANSLKRRFARIDEVNLLWSPAPKQEAPKAGGIFGHLKHGAKSVEDALVAEAGRITWTKFASTILPKAVRIQVRLASRMNFCGVMTAVDPDSPPILQWDLENARNPVSWYVYHNGSAPFAWGLSGMWAEATGVMLKPSMWAGDDRFAHMGKGVLIILDGAKDSLLNSLPLFPETLKSELHQIRSTIEAFAKAGKPEGADEGTANGVLIAEKGINAPIIRVTTAIGVSDYRVDRWD